MSHLDKLRLLKDAAKQMLRGEPLSKEQLHYFGAVLLSISAGEDANVVLGVRPNRGQKDSDAVAKQRMSLILHWVAGAIEPDPQSGEKPLSIERACEQAIHSIVPIAKKLYPGADDRNYDVDYLVRCWSEPAYQHMRSSLRQFFDNDFPY